MQQRLWLQSDVYSPIVFLVKADRRGIKSSTVVANQMRRSAQYRLHMLTSPKLIYIEEPKVEHMRVSP